MNGVETTDVSVASAHEPLGVATVTVAPLGGYEGGEVAVLFAEGDAVVAIPGVSNSFVSPAGHGARLL